MTKTMTKTMSKPAGRAKGLFRHGMVAAAVMTAIFGVSLSVAHAQQAAPSEDKGFKTLKSKTVELGSEIDGMQGRQLRLRVLTIEPGGHIKMHSHKDRPAVVYFIQGTSIVTSSDGTVKKFEPGDVSSATKATAHWHRNDGKEPVVFIAVDILHKNP